MTEKNTFEGSKEAMTNTITYAGRTFTLGEDYEHPDYGRVRLMAFDGPRSGFFRTKRGEGLVLPFDSFPRSSATPIQETP